MKKVLSIVLALALVVGCVGFIPNTGLASAETASEEWELLGDNSGLSWQTCSDELESQTVSFGSTVKTKSLRFYATEVPRGDLVYILREIEILDKNGNNIASSKLWQSNVTVSTTLSDVSSGQLSNLCNGNGGVNGYDQASDKNWDKFQGKASETGYIQLTFAEEKEIAAVRIWCSDCISSSWGGNAPKTWKITGLKTITMDDDGFQLLGDNAKSDAWATEPSNDFEYQDITLDKPVWLDRIRLRITDVYATSNTWRISEFEAFDTAGVNVLASATTDYKCDSTKGQYATNADGYKRTSLATVIYADGMPAAKTESTTEKTGDMIVNGENMNNQEHWYDRSNAKANLDNDYITFVFDRPYEIASVRLWSNWCNGTTKWGCAPKTWQLWGSKVQSVITDSLENESNWSDATGFTFADGQAAPSSSADSSMYAGSEKMEQYRVEAELYATCGQMGVYTHVTDESYYLTTVDKDTDTVFLYKGSTKVAEKYWPTNDSIELAITVNGSKVSVWSDEVKLIDYEDGAPLVAGKYGLYGKSTDGYFESVSVTPIDVVDTLPADYPYAPTVNAITEEISTGDFYVSVNGNDTNDGKSLETPFATIQRAQQAVRVAQKANPDKDYVVIIRGGIYYQDATLTMSAEDGGNGQHRIVYAAYPGETPVISGGKKVTSAWEKSADNANIYVTTLPDAFKNVDIRQVFVNDTRATRSREPDIGETVNSVNENGYWYLGAVADDYTWISPEGTLPASWATLSNSGVEMFFRVNWEFQRQTVAEFNTSTNRVTVQNGTLASGNTSIHPSVSLKDWVYFENALEFVDTPNEWYYDKANNKLYYFPEEGTDPNKLDITIPCLEKLVDVVGTEEAPVKNMDFLGLQFSHTTWYMPQNGMRAAHQGGLYTEIVDGVVTTVLPEAAVNFSYAESINIQNCAFTMLGEGALKIAQGANGNRIDSNTFTDVGGYGIYIGHTGQSRSLSWTAEQYDDRAVPRGNVIFGNYLNYCGTVDRSCLGIWATFLNHTRIEANTLQNINYTGISVGWRWNTDLYSSHHNEIISNKVINVMKTMHDGAGIYVLGSQYGSKINDNLVQDTAGVNIYFDQGSRFFECSGNYMSDYDIFYHMCSKDELLNRGYVNVETNQIGVEPEDLGNYGCKTGEIGDVNYDNCVDIRDVIRLKRHLAELVLRIDRAASDVTEDGIVNNHDLAALRTALVAPKVVVETNHTAKTDFTAPTNDYLTTRNLQYTRSNDTLSKVCDNNYSSAYDSGSSFTLPEEFVFKFEAPIEHETTLRLAANYASKQGPSKVEIYVQQGGDAWEQVRNSNLIWADIDSNQCVEIPLKVTGITGLKVVVTQANLTWNHYIISEMDLF